MKSNLEIKENTAQSSIAKSIAKPLQVCCICSMHFIKDKAKKLKKNLYSSMNRLNNAVQIKNQTAEKKFTFK